MLLPHPLSTRSRPRPHHLGELAAAFARAWSLVRRRPFSGAVRHRWPDPELSTLAFFLALIGLTFLL